MGEEQTKVTRPIDQAAHESYNWFNKSYVYIKKTKMQTWQSIFILAFITGAVAAIIFTVSADWHSASQAADSVTIPRAACVANPQGGTFEGVTAIDIYCGNQIKEAYYAWDDNTPVKINKVRITRRISRFQAQTEFGATADQTLKIYGKNSNRRNNSFSISYEFKTPACPRVSTENNTYYLEPCSVDIEMQDGGGNVPFTFTLMRASGEALYGFSVYGYGQGFPTYAILGGASSGGAQGDIVFNKYFNDNVINATGDQPEVITGYLPIKVYEGSASADNQKELRLNINLTVLPSEEPGTPCEDSDGGTNYEEKGSATGYDWNGGDAVYTYDDECAGDYTLWEYYCSYENDPRNGLGYVAQINAPCNWGCIDGACTPEPVAEHYFIDINCSVYGCDGAGFNDDDVIVAWSIGSNKITTPDNPSDGVFDLMFPGATNMQVNNVNNNGVVVGSYDVKAGANHGFMYYQGHYTAVDKPGASDTQVLDINDLGAMLVSTDNGTNHYLYDGQTYSLIDISNLTGGVNVSFRAINNQGHLLGNFWGYQPSSFIYDGAKLTIIEYPNDKGTYATGFNDNGQVVGYYIDMYNTNHSFYYDSTGIKDFLHPSLNDQGIGYTLQDINNKGHVLGSYSWYGPSGTTKISFLAIPLGQPTPPSPIPNLASIYNTMENGVIINGLKRIGQYKFIFQNESVDKAQLKNLRLGVDTMGINVNNYTAYLADNPAVKTVPTVSTSSVVYFDLSPLIRNSNSSSEVELIIQADITEVSIGDMLQTRIFNVNEAFNYMTKYGLRYPDMPWNTNVEGGSLSN